MGKKLFYLIVLLLLMICVLAETAFITLPLTLVLIFCLGLNSFSSNKYYIAFFGGLLYDLLSGTVFPAATIFFLTTVFIVEFYRSHLPLNLLTTGFLFLILAGGFFHITGTYPDIIKMSTGLILFLIINKIISVGFKPEQRGRMQFDIQRKR